MTLKEKCNVCDCYAAVCPKCQHRCYIYDKNNGILSPESLYNSLQHQAICDNCGTLVITVPKVTAWCECKKCQKERELSKINGRHINEPINCTCGGQI